MLFETIYDSDGRTNGLGKLEHIKSITAVCELDPAQIHKLIPQSFGKVCSRSSLSI